MKIMLTMISFSDIYEDVMDNTDTRFVILDNQGDSFFHSYFDFDEKIAKFINVKKDKYFSKMILQKTLLNVDDVFSLIVAENEQDKKYE